MAIGNIPENSVITRAKLNEIIDDVNNTLGNNQTWQNFDTTKFLDAPYTNDTSRPIYVKISVACTKSPATSGTGVVSLSLENSSGSFRYDQALHTNMADSESKILTLSSIILPNGSYKINSTSSFGMSVLAISSWKELR